ncbi:hypothetical protein QBC99_002689 [Beijerinckia sp. GAS462]|nr:hypothetical protein [Beijerinckia sp. GAS462]SEC53139.1 hypothetical protein SAMN05443249_2910 [Beijerinckia sp. 28-YEA-48]
MLFELLSRWCDPKATHTPSGRCFESTAECAVLQGLRADLEKQLVAPFQDDYNQIVEDARSRLVGLWDYPTLKG